MELTSVQRQLTEDDWESQENVELDAQYGIQNAMCSRKTVTESTYVCWADGCILFDSRRRRRRKR